MEFKVQKSQVGQKPDHKKNDSKIIHIGIGAKNGIHALFT